LIYAQKKILC